MDRFVCLNRWFELVVARFVCIDYCWVGLNQLLLGWLELVVAEVCLSFELLGVLGFVCSGGSGGDWLFGLWVAEWCWVACRFGCGFARCCFVWFVLEQELVTKRKRDRVGGEERETINKWWWWWAVEGLFWFGFV